MPVANAHAEPGYRAAARTQNHLTDELLELRPDLIRTATQWTGQEAAAEDLFQDMLSRVLGRGARFRPGSNLKAWATCIMRNLFIDGYRRRRRELALDFEIEGTLGAPAQIGPADLIELDDVRSALATLPGKDQQIFTLWYVRGLSYRELSAELGILPRTVGTRLHRVRVRLRGKLQALYEARLLALAEGDRDREREERKPLPIR